MRVNLKYTRTLVNQYINNYQHMISFIIFMNHERLLILLFFCYIRLKIKLDCQNLIRINTFDAPQQTRSPISFLYVIYEEDVFRKYIQLNLMIFFFSFWNLALVGLFEVISETIRDVSILSAAQSFQRKVGIQIYIPSKYAKFLYLSIFRFRSK